MRSGLTFGFTILLMASGPLARADFIATLPPGEVKRLGLDRLSPEERAAVDAAVEQYCQTHEAKATQQAAAAAVVEYKARQEPAAIARAVEVVKQRDEEDRIERFKSRVLGRFTGWGGRTYFALENGQLWQQVGSEVYYLSPVENPEVEFRKASSGHFRLYLSDGTWVTVKRIR
jgi:hypothetical protein